MRTLEAVKLVLVVLFIARVVCKIGHIEGTDTIQLVGAVAGIIFFAILGVEAWKKRKVKSD